jgi:hypothetical protein
MNPATTRPPRASWCASTSGPAAPSPRAVLEGERLDARGHLDGGHELATVARADLPVEVDGDAGPDAHEHSARRAARSQCRGPRTGSVAPTRGASTCRPPRGAPAAGRSAQTRRPEPPTTHRPPHLTRTRARPVHARDGVCTAAPEHPLPRRSTRRGAFAAHLAHFCTLCAVGVRASRATETACAKRVAAHRGQRGGHTWHAQRRARARHGVPSGPCRSRAAWSTPRPSGSTPW